jgi:flagellar assembly factor FliW
MQVASDRFGTLEVGEDMIVSFPDGILGFPESRRYALVDDRNSGVYFWLQSVEDASLAFLSVVPWAFFGDYQIELPTAEEEALGLPAEADVLVLCLLTVLREEGLITANLLGPLVINTTRRVGRQVVLADSGYPVRAPLAA